MCRLRLAGAEQDKADPHPPPRALCGTPV